jgi:peptide chain release factor 1
MFSKIQEIEERFNQLESELARSEVVREQKTYQKYMKEHRALAPIVEAFRKYQTLQHEIENNRSILDDPDQEIRKLAKEEIERLKTDLAQKENEIKVLLLPQDPNDEKNIILEIRPARAGTKPGFSPTTSSRMYLRYAELKGWKTEIMSLSHSGAWWHQEVIVLIAGDKVYSRLKHEGGVHRVQRVPETEAQGRIHTSAVTVAVLPEAEEVDVQINSDDLRIDVYRSSGRGGQHVNVTDSAVRITHLPSGLVVACQDERSQHKNKAKAMKVLRSRLLDREQTEQQMKISEERRSMVGSGDRSEKIRTYNYPQGRVTDHRIGLTIYRLDTVLQGQMDLILDPIITHFQAESLKADQRPPLANQRGPLAA